MSIYSDTFYANDINLLLSERSAIAEMLKVEAALANAQAALGIIPADAAKIISISCNVDFIDINKIKSDIKLGGNAAIPLVKELTKVIKTSNFEASKYVHFGATSQDIIDTASILTIKKTISWMEDKLNTLETALITLTKEHKNTIMVGRTLLQQARPITFGLKTAGWLESITRSRLRLQTVKNDVLQIQLGGAVGSGNNHITEDVQSKFANNLGLRNAFPWQSQRDDLNEFSCILGILSGTLGKIAKDISLMMQTEVAEVFEGAQEDKGGSSTMPHKRNPVTCALILSNSTRTPGLVSTMLSAMIQEHERSAGYWHAEWETLTQLIGLTAGSLEKSIDLIQNLEVDSKRMLKNIEITNGLIYAEKVSFILSKTIGKMQAHEAIKKSCQLSISSGKHLKEIISEAHPEIENIEELFKPENVIGNSIEWVEKILKSYKN
ncbi:3-carboxy-cis,cis-muconate cycloisomerase [Confluentibacter flavum]|uniref:3-carboxy-cis,cis-muconate cycloisomerase n=1 Tax=Confluentibacter flavum TaxID=1909700 RepID=A0A2N3HHT3_9FLAO|nr:3-carboxy-cis,cis-muconate cycloisomerase [Confluentibacter flavum]PKQ44529.1 3-carboxy-cis,cis-muconate cycloisomerase [Confluentibacter flavum]